jgi:hypothetical protein
MLRISNGGITMAMGGGERVDLQDVSALSSLRHCQIAEHHYGNLDAVFKDKSPTSDRSETSSQPYSHFNHRRTGSVPLALVLPVPICKRLNLS